MDMDTSSPAAKNNKPNTKLKTTKSPFGTNFTVQRHVNITIFATQFSSISVTTTPDLGSPRNLFVWLPMTAAVLIFLIIICVCFMVCRRRREVTTETYNNYSHVDQTEFVDFNHAPDQISKGDIGYEDVTIAMFDIVNSGNQDVSESEQPPLGDKNSNILEKEKFKNSNMTMSGPQFSEPKETFSLEMDQNLQFSPFEIKINTLDAIQFEKPESENFQIGERNDCHNTLVNENLLGPQFSGPAKSTLPGSIQSSPTESEKPKFFPAEGGSDNYFILKPSTSYTEDEIQDQEGSQNYFTLELSPK